jgi:hypothetical protein
MRIIQMLFKSVQLERYVEQSAKQNKPVNLTPDQQHAIKLTGTKSTLNTMQVTLFTILTLIS